MKRVGIIAILGALVLVAIGVLYLKFISPKDTVDTLERTEHSEPETVSIAEFITKNISSISPVSEQLGGTFYVTRIETRDSSGTVEYEDGHNAYTADFTYQISATGTPSVTSFVVR